MKAKKSFSVLLSSVMAVSMVPLSSFTTVAENGSTDREYLTEKLPFTADLLEDHYNYSGKDFSISADDYYGSYDSYRLAGDGASIRANGDYTIIKSVDAVVEYGADGWENVTVTPDTAVKSSVSDHMVTVTDINSDSLNLCESGGTVHLSDVTVYYLDYAGVFEAYEYDSNVGMWDFTYSSWKTESDNYYAAIDAICNIVCDFEDGRYDAVQSELDDAVDNYYAVMNRLEERPPVDPENVAGNDDYAALEDALDAGNNISRDKYTEESSSALSAALSYAMEVYYAAYGVEMSVPVQFSKDEIAAVIQSVNDAIDALEMLSDDPSANYEDFPFSMDHVNEDRVYLDKSDNFALTGGRFDSDGLNLLKTFITSTNDSLMIDKVEMTIAWYGQAWGDVIPSSGTKLETEGVENGSKVTITDVNDYDLSFIDLTESVQVNDIKVYYKEAEDIDYDRLWFSADNIDDNYIYSYKTDNVSLSAREYDFDGSFLCKTFITSTNNSLMIDKVELTIGYYGQGWGDVTPSSGTKLETEGVENGSKVTITDVNDYDLTFRDLNRKVQVRTVKVYYKEAEDVDYERLRFDEDNADEYRLYSSKSDNFKLSAEDFDFDGTYLFATVISSTNDSLLIDKVEMMIGYFGDCWDGVSPSSGIKLETDGVENGSWVTITDVNASELSFKDFNDVQIKSVKVYYKELPADYTELDAAVKNAEALDENVYTSESWTALQTALDAAKDVSRDLTISDQSVVDAAKNALDAAVSELVYLPYDYTFLDSAIEYAEKLKAEDFTSESWAVLQTALDAAKGVSRDLTVIDGGSADLIADSLDDAINALELLFVENSLVQAPTINEAGLYDYCLYYYDTNNDKVIYKEEKDLEVEFADWYLRTAVQTRTNIPESANYRDTTLDLRFISMLDENLSDYKEAGFIFTINGVEVDKKLSTNTATNSFIVNGDTVDISCYSEADDYFFIQIYTLTYDEVIDLGSNDIPLTVTPYVILVNGEKLEGKTVEFLITDLMY